MFPAFSSSLVPTVTVETALVRSLGASSALSRKTSSTKGELRLPDQTLITRVSDRSRPLFAVRNTGTSSESCQFSCHSYKWLFINAQVPPATLIINIRWEKQLRCDRVTCRNHLQETRKQPWIFWMIIGIKTRGGYWGRLSHSQSDAFGHDQCGFLVHRRCRCVYPQISIPCPPAGSPSAFGRQQAWRAQRSGPSTGEARSETERHSQRL